MKNIIYFFLLNTIFCFSQNKFLIVDSMTKEPLPFILVKFNNNDGGYSNEKGSILINDEIVTLELREVGYETKKVLVSTIKDTINLDPHPQVLEEITISNFKEKKKINSLKSPTIFGNCILVPESEIISILFPASEVSGFYIDDITFYFIKLKGSKYRNVLKDELAVVRINIYDLKDEIPNKLIFSSKPLKINAYEKDNISISIKDEYITFENTGIAFAIEYIGNINVHGELYKSKDIYLRPELIEDKSKFFKGNLLQRFQLKQNKLIDLIDIWNEGFSDNRKISGRLLNISLNLSK